MAVVASALIASACSSLVNGTGSAGTPTGTGSHTDFPTNSNTPGPNRSAPTPTDTSTGKPGGDTAIGDARTANLCPALDPSAFAKYGQPGSTYRATPVE
jgi:hypothetical protein